MSAEGNLSDPTIFAEPPKEHNPREYWYGVDGKGGYRLDAVFRRYMDIIHKYSLDQSPPERAPLYVPGDRKDTSHQATQNADEPVEPLNNEKRKRETSPEAAQNTQTEQVGRRNNKKQKRDYRPDPSMKAMHGHLFGLLKPLLSVHTDIRDVLAKTRHGDIEGFERILSLVEAAVRKGLDEHAATTTTAAASEKAASGQVGDGELTHKEKTEAKYKRPWFVCQPSIRPLPEEALKIGSLQLSKKEAARLAANETVETTTDPVARTDDGDKQIASSSSVSNELPKPALVCG